MSLPRNWPYFVRTTRGLGRLVEVGVASAAPTAEANTSSENVSQARSHVIRHMTAFLTTFRLSYTVPISLAYGSTCGRTAALVPHIESTGKMRTRLT
ncbi:hypothetical protein MRX96_054412 [Rhipicephalus microplus]